MRKGEVAGLVIQSLRSVNWTIWRYLHLESRTTNVDRQGETQASLRRGKIGYSSLYEVTDNKICIINCEEICQDFIL